MVGTSDVVVESIADGIRRSVFTGLALMLETSSSVNEFSRENSRWTISVKVCSADFRSSSLSRISKHSRKHVCINSHTLSLLMHVPTGVSRIVRSTCKCVQINPECCERFSHIPHNIINSDRAYIARFLTVVFLTRTCRIFMRTTSSLAMSVPTNLACVTASAMFSIPAAAEGDCISINPYDKNLFMDDNATAVIGPVVASERTTAKNGPKKTSTSTSSKSVMDQNSHQYFDLVSLHT